MEVDVGFARAGGCGVVVVPTGSRSRGYLSGVGADAMIADLTELPGLLRELKHPAD
jgi:phosphoglycolate phosphatase-like HAD superfamily hydrolase